MKLTLNEITENVRSSRCSATHCLPTVACLRPVCTFGRERWPTRRCRQSFPPSFGWRSSCKGSASMFCVRSEEDAECVGEADETRTAVESAHHEFVHVFWFLFIMQTLTPTLAWVDLRVFSFVGTVLSHGKSYCTLLAQYPPAPQPGNLAAPRTCSKACHELHTRYVFSSFHRHRLQRRGKFSRLPAQLRAKPSNKEIHAASGWGCRVGERASTGSTCCWQLGWTLFHRS